LKSRVYKTKNRVKRFFVPHTKTYFLRGVAFFAAAFLFAGFFATFRGVAFFAAAFLFAGFFATFREVAFFAAAFLFAGFFATFRGAVFFFTGMKYFFA